ncbi:unnamed protein product [Mycena citricolor]|uniref:Uncharacterized protein n=1 Tax=Mycena citricolor TaxID=2018698 RepID=A0AAD2GYD0_9AGAR|nr:unnamed protein product [Mycena citricolor]CAK5282648.1 unnamed protein product [Mycena citricolor]
MTFTPTSLAFTVLSTNAGAGPSSVATLSPPASGRSKSDAARSTMMREKSTRPAREPRRSELSVALSSCCVEQYTPVPFVHTAVVFANASPRRFPPQNASAVAVSHSTTRGPAELIAAKAGADLAYAARIACESALSVRFADLAAANASCRRGSFSSKTSVP